NRECSHRGCSSLSHCAPRSTPILIPTPVPPRACRRSGPALPAQPARRAPSWTVPQASDARPASGREDDFPDDLAPGSEWALELPVEHHADPAGVAERQRQPLLGLPDRKSTRLNSSHVSISYAVFCLKK